MSKEALRHHQQIKEVEKQGQVLPPQGKFANFIDRIIYPVGLLGPVMTFPQLFEVWIHKSAGDLSLITWGGWLILSFIWLVYGILHKDKPIIISNILWVVIEFGVSLAIILYR